MTKMPRKITQADVDRSYELAALLEVCKGAATVLNEQVGSQSPSHVQLSGALPAVIQQALDKWSEVHDALELAQHDEDPPQTG